MAKNLTQYSKEELIEKCREEVRRRRAAEKQLKRKTPAFGTAPQHERSQAEQALNDQIKDNERMYEETVELRRQLSEAKDLLRRLYGKQPMVRGAGRP